jgi:uncharacterized membrane-anchored protein
LSLPGFGRAFFSLPKIWFWSEPLSEPFGSHVCPFDDFFLDYARFGSVFVAFAFMLCTANYKVTFMLNFQTKRD